MTYRKRGKFTLPQEFVTNEKLTTKRELGLAQLLLMPSCPPAPRIKRSTLCSANTTTSKPKPIFFNNSVTLSTSYDASLNSSYFEQMFSNCSLTGEGSFGKVYKVISREDNQIYAVKRLKQTIKRKDRYAEIRNYEIVGSHPNIVEFFMAWEEDSNVYMLLEYCDLSLFDFSVFNSDIPEDVLWSILYDICKALNYLHGNHLLHLDVKPGNIMIKKGYFKLTDLGILVDLDQTPLAPRMFSDGDPKYLALEVLDGIYQPSSDIFGLGISLLELASDLVLPTNGPLWQQLRHEILPESFYEKVSLGFQVIIERMLRPEYKKRPTAETILKYSTLKDVERRDKKQPRIDYVKQMSQMNRYRFPVFVNNNNNIVSTPPYSIGDASLIDSPPFCPEAGKRVRSGHLQGRKLLLEEYEKDEKSSKLDINDDFNLAADLSSSDISMDTSDEDEVAVKSNWTSSGNQLSSFCCLSDTEMVTSTPNLKVSCKMPRVKLSFD